MLFAVYWCYTFTFFLVANHGLEQWTWGYESRVLTIYTNSHWHPPLHKYRRFLLCHTMTCMLTSEGFCCWPPHCTVHFTDSTGMSCPELPSLRKPEHISVSNLIYWRPSYFKRYNKSTVFFRIKSLVVRAGLETSDRSIIGRVLYQLS